MIGELDRRTRAGARRADGAAFHVFGGFGIGSLRSRGAARDFYTSVARVKNHVNRRSAKNGLLPGLIEYLFIQVRDSLNYRRLMHGLIDQWYARGHDDAHDGNDDHDFDQSEGRGKV